MDVHVKRSWLLDLAATAVIDELLLVIKVQEKYILKIIISVKWEEMREDLKYSLITSWGQLEITNPIKPQKTDPGQQFLKNTYTVCEEREAVCRYERVS